MSLDQLILSCALFGVGLFLSMIAFIGEVLWHKGDTSGLTQIVKEFRIDDDQDCIWLRVHVQGNGASCHVGYRSCFYRSVPTGNEFFEKEGELTYEETEKVLMRTSQKDDKADVI